MRKLDNLTKDKLIALYVKESKSLEDIAQDYNVSRVAVYKKLKKHGIQQRSKSEARLQAQKQGKLSQQFFDINEDFFNSWSPEMAYVLGLIITDGCIFTTVVSLCMNDKELLQKVKAVMGSTHKIESSKHQKGLYIFRFARENMVRKLGTLGVIPKKSLVVKFPNVPEEYLPDFIRGVFDGDGSVFYDKRRPNFPLRANFVSGSIDFIEGLQRNLEYYLGMSKRTIYKQKTKNGWSYMFIYDHKDSVKLFKILYKNPKNELFLERKYKRFLAGLKAPLKEGENG